MEWGKEAILALAVRRARRLVRAWPQTVVSLRIHARSGRILEERTYPRAADRCPPRG